MPNYNYIISCWAARSGLTVLGPAMLPLAVLATASLLPISSFSPLIRSAPCLRTMPVSMVEDADWSELDAWLTSSSERNKGQAATAAMPTRQRWSTTAKGHVHDSFWSSGTKSWSQLGVSERLEANLVRLGFERPSRTQSLSYKAMMSSEAPVLLADANGMGKTLAYVAPLVQRLWDMEESEGRTPPGEVRAIIIVPTTDLAMQVLELARDVANRSIRASIVTGEHSWATQRERMGGGLELVVATMGRFVAHLHPRDRAPSVSLQSLRMLVVDEASSLYAGSAPAYLARAQSRAEARSRDPLGGPRTPRQDLPIAMWRWLSAEIPAECVTAMVTSALPEAMEAEMRADLPGLHTCVGNGLHRTRGAVDVELVDCSRPVIVDGGESIFGVWMLWLTEPQHALDAPSALAPSSSCLWDAPLSLPSRSLWQAKLEELRAVLSRSSHALVLSNTAATCERIERALATDPPGPVAVYVIHGSMPAQERAEILAAFRSPPAAADPLERPARRVLVATGQAARGLELSAGPGRPLDHVVLFDFAPNAKAYLAWVGAASRGPGPMAPVTALAVNSQVAFARALLSHDEEGVEHDIGERDNRR